MSKPVIYPDGSKCWTGPTCKKHAQAWRELQTKQITVEDLKVSKTISYLLRHKPDAANIVLNTNGSVNIEEFIKKLNIFLNGNPTVTRERLEKIVATDSKQRYKIENNTIRAVQGHSVKVNLNLTPKQPPKFLYHGTTSEVINQIRAEGLKPMTREYVHLSADKETATNVGNRHKGELIILKINAEQAYNSGIEFYQAENGVWLVKSLTPNYLK